MNAVLLEFAQHLASPEPFLTDEESDFQVRLRSGRYFVIHELDAARLLAVRELVLALEPQ